MRRRSIIQPGPRRAVRRAASTRPSTTARENEAARQRFHPDEVTGALSSIIGRFARPSVNTLADLDVYRGLGEEIPLRAPEKIPAARAFST